MTSPILVTGGTGTLGRRVVARMREAGYDVRVLSRHSGAPAAGVEYFIGDLASGAGVDAAVAGVGTVVHCAGTAKGDGEKAQNLVRAASAASVRHIVYISVVGADRVPIESGMDRAMFGYFGSKLAGEQAIAASGVPWTTLRATQFYDLTLVVAEQMAKLPLIPIPIGAKFQPVDTDEVAARLVDLALGEPAGLVPDVAGPRIYPMGELVRGYLSVRHKRRWMVSLPLPGKAARAIRAGVNLSPERAVGRRTWEEFLAGRFRLG